MMARAASQASQKASRALHQVALLPCLSDNYVFLLREAGGKVAVVDPGEKGMLGKLKRELDELGWEAPSFILNTHHHYVSVLGDPVAFAGVRTPPAGGLT